MTVQIKNKVLVAYFSYSGNTREIAQQIQERTNGDIFEIERVTDYPAHYNDVVAEAKQEIKSGAKPLLSDKIDNMGNYELIFLGYPNWWNTFPAPVSTFLSGYNFNRKTIIPFCTHGGGGVGRSVSDIVKQCPGAEVTDEFSIHANAVNTSNTQVKKWLDKLLNTGIS